MYLCIYLCIHLCQFIFLHRSILVCVSSPPVSLFLFSFWHSSSYCQLYPWQFLLSVVSLAVPTVSCIPGSSYCQLYPWQFLQSVVSLSVPTVSCIPVSSYCQLYPCPFLLSVVSVSVPTVSCIPVSSCCQVYPCQFLLPAADPLLLVAEGYLTVAGAARSVGRAPVELRIPYR